MHLDGQRSFSTREDMGASSSRDPFHLSEFRDLNCRVDERSG